MCALVAVLVLTRESQTALVALRQSVPFVCFRHLCVHPLLGVDAQDVVEVINEAEQYYSEFCAGFSDCDGCLAAVNVSASGVRYS